MSNFEGFLEDAAKASSGYRARGCQVGAMLNELDESDAAQVRHAISRPELTASSIYQALRSRLGDDITPSQYTINRHRRGLCKCEEK